MKYQIVTEPIDTWTYKVNVYLGFKFIGKAITNDPETVAQEIIEKYEEAKKNERH